MGHDKIVTEEQAKTIAYIRRRLRNSVTIYRIINWLNNFPKDEWDSALSVLGALKYYSNNQLIYEFNEGLARILDWLPEDKMVYIHGFGELGKSGSTMLYFLKQSATFKENEARIKILSNVDKLKQKGIKQSDHLIFIDDFIGSGESFVKFYNHEIKSQLIRGNIQLNVHLLSVVYMAEGELNIREQIPNINVVGTKYFKAFAKRGSVFGYRPKMLPIRKFCYERGKELFNLYDYRLKLRVPHPLGFKNSQSLVVFAHSVPNNTIPIIWSSKGDWFPLYPRTGEAKLSETKDFQMDNYYWLNLAYKLKVFDKFQPTIPSGMDQKHFKLIAVIRLKKQKSGPERIFQLLGLSVNEFEAVIAYGRSLGLINGINDVSSLGTAAYEKIKSLVRLENTRNRRKNYTFKEPKMYIPKQFGGVT